MTRMRWAASSLAIGSVIPTTPPLEAEYAACPICPSNAATDAVLTMTPRSPSTGSVAAMARAARRMTLNVPSRFTLSTRSKVRQRKRPVPPERLARRADSRAVHHDPQRCAGGIHRGLHLGLVGDIRRHEGDTVDLSPAGGRQVEDDHVGACREQFARRGQPEARRSPGDQGGASADLHGHILSITVALAIPPPSHMVCSPYRPPLDSR